MQKTEERNPRTMNIDKMDTLAMLQVMNEENYNAVKAVEKVLPQVEQAVDAVSIAFKNGGRLFYIGAGTSGRLGVVDASECPPTFGVDPGMVVGIIAGGVKCLYSASENAEDNGMYIDEDEVGAGLFRGTAAGSTIQNLKIENSYITSTANYVGSVAGSTSGSIVNVKSEAKIVSNKEYVGGIVGQIWSDDSAKINISGCWYAGNMNVKRNAGGIVAIISRGDIEISNCLNSGQIQYKFEGTKGTGRWVGGLIGRSMKVSGEWTATGDTTVTLNLVVTNCLNTGNIKDYSFNARVGSVIGENNKYVTPTFTNVYTTEESYKYKVSDTELHTNTVGRDTKGNSVTIAGITSVPESTIKVSATNNVTADDVLATLRSWGFDTAVWTIGTTEGSKPVLKQQ